jgi:hypothetical protein
MVDLCIGSARVQVKLQVALTIDQFFLGRNLQKTLTKLLLPLADTADKSHVVGKVQIVTNWSLWWLFQLPVHDRRHEVFVK